jgi:hypothetical protein
MEYSVTGMMSGGMMGMSGKGGKKITAMDLRCKLCINDRRVTL